MWTSDNKSLLDLIRPDILQLPNEVRRAEEAGWAREDKNNKQQTLWLEGKVSGHVAVGYCEPTLFTSRTDREREEKRRREGDEEGEEYCGVHFAAEYVQVIVLCGAAHLNTDHHHF